MKQTVQQAARKFAGEDPTGCNTLNQVAMSAFTAGAEWQAKQSPWININERLPENKDEVLVLSRMNRSGKYFVAEDSYNGKEWSVSSAMHYTRIAWMPIPSFDEILEANKDVLERIKEKGD